MFKVGKLWDSFVERRREGVFETNFLGSIRRYRDDTGDEIVF